MYKFKFYVDIQTNKIELAGCQRFKQIVCQRNYTNLKHCQRDIQSNDPQ